MTPTKTKKPESSNAAPPIGKIRVGLITASIWQRESEGRTFHSVSFERRYRDAEGNWQTAHTYDSGDLLALAKASDLAHTRILELQTEA